MILLITTQVVDPQDPILGFFCRWIEEFAKHCEGVEVICLRESAHTLPANVRVHALGSGNKLVRAWRLLRLSQKLHYEAVFIHMNPEYLVAAGWLWRMSGKRTALWYTHKSVDLKLRIAARMTDVILTASKESFRLPTGKLRVMGHGIDVDFFSPGQGILRGSNLLSVGRLMPSKRHDLAIRAAAQAGVALHIAGSGPEQVHLEALADELGVKVTFLGGITQTQLRDEYRRAAKLIHTSETGSLDKVVLEALACGLPVATSDPALKPLESVDPSYVRQNHSLATLIPKVLGNLS
jgi:glycosyltransferase involved in cell wall biosynthesis